MSKRSPSKPGVGVLGILGDRETRDKKLKIPTRDQIIKIQNQAMINNWMDTTQIHYSKEDLKQLSDEEFDRIYKVLDTYYNKFTEKIHIEIENIKQDEKELERILNDTPDDQSTVEKIRNFINDSKQLIIQFTELKTHIDNSLSVFDKLRKLRQTLNEILKTQKIRPIDTRPLSPKSLRALETQTGRTATRPSTAKHGSNPKRHYYGDYGGKHKKTRKHRKSRSRK